MIVYFRDFNLGDTMKFGIVSSTALCLLGLTGCVTGEDIDAGVNTFKGQHYKVAFAALGFPDAENKIAGYTVYTWGNQSSGSYVVPTTQTATSYVNGQVVYTTVQGSTVESYNYQCKLDLIVDNSGTVVDTKVDGNIGGCERYARFAPKKKKPGV